MHGGGPDRRVVESRSVLGEQGDERLGREFCYGSKNGSQPFAGKIQLHRVPAGILDEDLKLIGLRKMLGGVIDTEVFESSNGRREIDARQGDMATTARKGLPRFTDFEMDQVLLTPIKPETVFGQRWSETKTQIEHAGVKRQAAVDELGRGADGEMTKSGDDHGCRFRSISRFQFMTKMVLVGALIECITYVLIR